MKSITCAVAMLLGVTVISAGSSDLEGQLSRMASIDQFVWNGPLFLKDTSLERLRKLTDLRNESTTKKPNKHNPSIETEFKTFQYDGLQIYGFVRDSKELGLITVKVSNPKWQILHKLNVGTPFKQVLDTLGQPTRSEGAMSEYCGETECVQFEKKGNKIVEIRFLYYAD